MDLLVYFQPQDGSKYLLSTERNSKIDPRNDRYKMIKGGLSTCTFTDRVKKALTNVQIEANAHAREKFLTDIRKVREIEDPQQANQFLERMRTRLDNLDVLSVI